MYFANENSTYKALEQRLLKICLFALLPRYYLLYMCVSMRSYLTLLLPGDQQGISLYYVHTF